MNKLSHANLGIRTTPACIKQAVPRSFHEWNLISDVVETCSHFCWDQQVRCSCSTKLVREAPCKVRAAQSVKAMCWSHRS